MREQVAKTFFITGVSIPWRRLRDEAAHRGDVHDVPAPPAAHVRQHGLHDRHRAEHVDLELVAQGFERRLFDQALVSVAGVVDQHDAVASDAPPAHLLLGSDALRLVREKLGALQAEIERWQDTSRSTDFD